jgi:hypothetical protein
MNHVFALAKLLLLAAAFYLLVTLALFLRDARATLVHVDAVADQAKSAIGDFQKQFSETPRKLNLVLDQTSETVNQIRHVSMDERTFAQSANARSLDVLSQTDSLLSHISHTVDSTNDSQKEIARASVAALQSLRPAAESSALAMQQAANDLESLNTILADKNIPLTLAHVNDTAAHLDSMSVSLDVAVKRWTKPGSILKSLFTGLLDTGSKVAIIAK